MLLLLRLLLRGSSSSSVFPALFWCRRSSIAPVTVRVVVVCNFLAGSDFCFVLKLFFFSATSPLLAD
jgi:hypothetical protein